MGTKGFVQCPNDEALAYPHGDCVLPAGVEIELYEQVVIIRMLLLFLKMAVLERDTLVSLCACTYEDRGAIAVKSNFSFFYNLLLIFDRPSFLLATTDSRLCLLWAGGHI